MSILSFQQRAFTLASIISVIIFLNSATTSVNCKSFNWRSSSGSGDDYKVVCYYSNWAQYRPKPASYFPEDIDPQLCTHVIFAFAKINEASELEPFEWNDDSTDWSRGMYNRTIELKKKNRKLKVLIAVGGWNLNSLPFSNMAQDDMLRGKFVRKSVNFLKKRQFDGLDIDWEYPANRDTEHRPDDKQAFTLLCQDLSSAFEPHGLLLTAAVAAGEKYIESAYELAEIHKHLDFINLMAYDLHGSWDNSTGHNAGLFSRTFDRDQLLNVDYAVQRWIGQVPSKKLVLGLPTYGRSFLIDKKFEKCPLTDTPVVGPASAGKYTREAGFMAYYEICQKILNKQLSYVWNEEQKVPYAYSKNSPSSDPTKTVWVGFDDVTAFKHKADYIKKYQLGGGMIWALDMDDFTGEMCHQGKYPLLTTLSVELGIVKRSLPNPSVLWGKMHQDKPVEEKDFMLKTPAIIDESDVDMFGLMKNDQLQIYSYCQCKNGTHSLFSRTQLSTEDEPIKDSTYSYTIDCDRKLFYSSNESPPDNHRFKKPMIPQNKNKNAGGDDDEDSGSEKKGKKLDNNSIWSMFGIKTSSSAASTFERPENIPTTIGIFLICYFFQNH